MIRLFCEPEKDYIITLPPTYGMYDVSAAINAVQNKLVPLTEDFQIDLSALSSSWDDHAKLLFLCSPNNPSGNVFDHAAIEEVLRTFPGIVVVDEAYIDFSSVSSWAAQIDKYPNLVVLQTLSKAWGMAGIRVGVAMADPYVISMMDRIKPPYNISRINQLLALEALEGVDRKNEYVARILEERGRLEKALRDLPLVKKIYPSHTNFLLVRFDQTERVFKYLTDNKIIVRDRSKQLHCDGCLRITVGKPEENDLFLKYLKEFEA